MEIAALAGIPAYWSKRGQNVEELSLLYYVTIYKYKRLGSWRPWLFSWTLVHRRAIARCDEMRFLTKYLSAKCKTRASAYSCRPKALAMSLHCIHYVNYLACNAKKSITVYSVRNFAHEHRSSWTYWYPGSFQNECASLLQISLN